MHTRQQMAPLDELLLAEAREAQAAQAHAQAQAELARVRFAGTLRKLHGAGASMREIARALELSHQRVHQLVTGEDKHGRRLGCSFCGRDQKQASKLIAGPGVYICGRCVGLANRVLAGDAKATRSWTTTPRPDPGKQKKRGAGDGCSFCGKGPLLVAGMAEGGAVRICSECLDLCNDIIREERGEA